MRRFLIMILATGILLPLLAMPMTCNIQPRSPITPDMSGSPVVPDNPMTAVGPLPY